MVNPFLFLHQKFPRRGNSGKSYISARGCPLEIVVKGSDVTGVSYRLLDRDIVVSFAPLIPGKPVCVPLSHRVETPYTAVIPSGLHHPYWYTLEIVGHLVLGEPVVLFSRLHYGQTSCSADRLLWKEERSRFL
jgi:hypothetical protein